MGRGHVGEWRSSVQTSFVRLAFHSKHLACTAIVDTFSVELSQSHNRHQERIDERVCVSGKRNTVGGQAAGQWSDRIRVEKRVESRVSVLHGGS